MIRRHCKTSFIVLLSLSCLLQANARLNNTEDTLRTTKDSISRPAIASKKRVTGISNETNTDALVESSLLQADNYTVKTKAGVRALFHFLKSTRLSNASRDKRLAYRLYFGLAKTFVRMKLYPQAMQCYYQTLLLTGEKTRTPDSNEQHTEIDTAAIFLNEGHESIAAEKNLAADSLQIKLFDYLADNDSSIEKYLLPNKASVPVSNESITNTYKDGREAAAYAIVLHVKQPVPGKRRPFTRVNNVGHFFVTLIKYNNGAAAATRSFGFYPAKESFFAATPLHPASEPAFKDDALHDWDEAIGKFISRRRFEKIIRLVDHYNNRSYHLNKNNCTDFGLYAAAIAGVFISHTAGHWPLGKGNNPASAGQSMLEGKILNTDTGNTQDLFICNNIPGK